MSSTAFRNRLMIPICRDTGSVIAFGGRAMGRRPGAEIPQLAGDAHLLEGPDALRPATCRRARFEEVGFVGARGGLFRLRAGLSIARPRAGRRLVWHGADTPAGAAAAPSSPTKIVLSFDPDAAGQGAAIQIVRAARRRGASTSTSWCWIRARIPIRLSGGKAPAYRERLRTSRPYLEYCSIRRPQGVDLEHGG